MADFAQKVLELHLAALLIAYVDHRGKNAEDLAIPVDVGVDPHVEPIHVPAEIDRKFEPVLFAGFKNVTFSGFKPVGGEPGEKIGIGLADNFAEVESMMGVFEPFVLHGAILVGKRYGRAAKRSHGERKPAGAILVAPTGWYLFMPLHR